MSKHLKHQVKSRPEQHVDLLGVGFSIDFGNLSYFSFSLKRKKMKLFKRIKHDNSNNIVMWIWIVTIVLVNFGIRQGSNFFSVSLFLNINKTNESDSKKTSELKSRLFEICFVGLINYVALLEVDRRPWQHFSCLYCCHNTTQSRLLLKLLK